MTSFASQELKHCYYGMFTVIMKDESCREVFLLSWTVLEYLLQVKQKNFSSISKHLSSYSNLIYSDRPRFPSWLFAWPLVVAVLFRVTPLYQIPPSLPPPSPPPPNLIKFKFIDDEHLWPGSPPPIFQEVTQWRIEEVKSSTKDLNIFQVNNRKKAIIVPHNIMIIKKRKTHLNFSLLLIICSSQILFHVVSILNALN